MDLEEIEREWAPHAGNDKNNPKSEAASAIVFLLAEVKRLKANYNGAVQEIETLLEEDKESKASIATLNTEIDRLRDIAAESEKSDD